MVRINITEENLISTTGIADRRFADHSGDIQHGYQLGSLTEGLVAYYPMEKGQGRVLFDGATGNHGQIEGASWNGSGKVGSDALIFNGSNDWVDINDSFEPTGRTEFTLSAWVYWDGGNSGSNADVVHFDDIETLLSNNSSDEWLFFINDGSNQALNPVSATSGSWVHLAGTFSNSTMRLYVDGVEEGTRTGVGTPRDAEDTDSIGSDAGTGRYWSGRIDDVRVYDRALSQPEIEVLAGLTEPSGFLVEEEDVPTLREFERDLGGAVSRYEFENDVTDSWGDNDGTDNTSAGFVDGVYGQAKDFDGSDDYISTSHRFGSGQFSVFTWFNIDTLSHGNNQVDIVNGDGIRLIHNENVAFEARLGGSLLKTTEPQANEWNHFGITFDGTSVLGWLNGSVFGSDVNSFSGASSNTVIGDNGGSTNWWPGSLDDVRIYERALTPIEVETLFNKGAYRIKRGNL